MSTHPESTAQGDVMQVVCFGVGAQEYALDIMRVKEIINPAPVAVVPNAPAFIEGVIELRGAFLALIDLRKRFGLEPAVITRDTKFIVVTLGPGRPNVSLIVDRVLEVRRIERDDIGAPPALAIGPGSRFIAGVTRWNTGILMLVDLDRVLSGMEMQALGALE